MGGCRCIFRECTVATSRHPRMHFFRFPIKDQERLRKWVKMAKVPSLLQLPMSVQKNKCVCARHFRDECFMNYMKDKLVANAVPTLERIKGGYALDYEDGDKPKIVQLPEPFLQHMIPPPDFECPLHLEELENDFVEIEKGEIRPGCSSSIPKRKISTADSIIASKKVKILNTQAPDRELDITDTSTPDGYINKFVQFVDFSDEQQQEKYLLSMDDCVVNENDDSYADNTEMVIIETASIETPESEDKIIKDKTPKFIEVSHIINTSKAKRQNDEICQNYELQLDRERAKYVNYEEDSSKHQMQLVEALQTVSRDLEIKTLEYETDTQELKTKIEQLSAENNELQLKCENLSMSNSLLKTRLKTVEEKHANLQQQNQQLQVENVTLQQMQQQQQVSTVSTSKEAPCYKTSTTASPATLPAQSAFSKAQLFNGIKKYLSSSMVALVRMEMFGSAERQWKPDEKQASLDLLTLGENVYRYFTDEWRFRLPGLRQVLTWQNEAALATNDEEDL